MRIESVTEYSRGRMQLCLEDGRSFVLYRRELAQYGLTEGAELPQEVCEEIMELLRRRVLRRCGALLEKQDYTEAALRRKLQSDGQAEETIGQVLDSLKEAGYLDDARYAEHYICCHIADRSRERIRRDLAGKGISGEVLEEAFADFEETEDGGNRFREQEILQIQKLLERRQYDPMTADWAEKQKTMAFLYRKGYPQELIRRAVEDEDLL